MYIRHQASSIRLAILLWERFLLITFLKKKLKASGGGPEGWVETFDFYIILYSIPGKILGGLDQLASRLLGEDSQERGWGLLRRSEIFSLMCKYCITCTHKFISVTEKLKCWREDSYRKWRIWEPHPLIHPSIFLLWGDVLMTASSFCPIILQKIHPSFTLKSGLGPDHANVCGFAHFFGFLNNKHHETTALLPDQYITCEGKWMQKTPLHS